MPYGRPFLQAFQCISCAEIPYLAESQLGRRNRRIVVFVFWRRRRALIARGRLWAVRRVRWDPGAPDPGGAGTFPAFLHAYVLQKLPSVNPFGTGNFFKRNRDSPCGSVGHEESKPPAVLVF